MKSGFFSAGSLIVGLAAMFFASTALAQLEPTWVKDGVDWQQYGKFLVRPLVIDNVKVVKPPFAQDDPTEWTVQVEDLEGMQAIFRDVMSDVLSGNGGYPLVYGEITGRVELRDSTTRELLLLIEGNKAAGEKYKEFTRANNIANVEAMFTQFANRLRNAMDRVHGK
jgi:hypothetical protein